MLFELTALSVVLSFVSYEFTGILAGGLVSAGYLAYFFNEPTRILSTIAIALAITFIVKGLQCVLIIYGRRRFALSVLLSLFAVWALGKASFWYAGIGMDLRVIGYIIPGLIASDMEKQGIFKTLISLFSITMIIELCVILGA